MSERVNLEVTIQNIVFQADSGTFCVFRGQSPEYGMVTIVYKGMPPFAGEKVLLHGYWTEHPRFGRQFDAQSWEAEKPTGCEAITKMLGSGAIKGIGPAMAERIVKQFGEDTFRVLDENPERLLEVPGIGKKKAESIMASYADMTGTRELIFFLESHSISSNYAPRIQAIYGSTAITRISNNPYCLAEDVEGIGFKTADRLAAALGFDPSGSDRIRAGIRFTLLQSGSQGHTCVPDTWLIERAASIMALDPVDVRTVFNELLEQNVLRTEEVGGQTCVYAEYLYRAEVGTARRLLLLRDQVNSLWKVDYTRIIAQWEATEKIKLAPEQVEAIKASVEHGVFVLTGGPGTGKTTVVKGILSVLRESGCRILLAAPTGRAAKRLSESAGEPALTVHRMLEYTPNGDEAVWGRDEDNPLEADAVIVDEASMMDIVLMYNLLRALPIGCRLILVGDVDQLPSVGPGSVLKDIMRSGTMPIVRLENVFRQAQLSPIVRNAHRINQGLMPVWEGETDFSFRQFNNEEETAKYVVNQYAAIASRLAWQHVQVLSPMHRNPCGVDNLNRLIQARINPPAPQKAEIRAGALTVMREGDKVMQVRNNYEKNVFNGDIGRIDAIREKNVFVSFPDRPEGGTVVYEGNEISDLQLAYAMSVHKAQGSEYAVVIMPLVPSHYVMLQRNLFYTAVTRAKKQVYLAGSRRAMQLAVSNNRTQKRYSLLAERLSQGETDNNNQ
jgi:exodeoxyribonuclease V alpha subunit